MNLDTVNRMVGEDAALRRRQTLQPSGGKATRSSRRPTQAKGAIHDSRRVRPSIVGDVFEADGFSFAWPIWAEPATLSAMRALLTHPDLPNPAGIAHLGVDHVHVMVARRISVEQFLNFSRARPFAAK